MVNYGKARLVQLEEDVQLFEEMGIPPIQKLSGILNSVRQALTDLKIELSNRPFENTAEEIEFFKHVKPRIVAFQSYALEVFTIETNRPIGSSEEVKAYYEQELKFVKRFLDTNQFLYQYYLLDIKDLDALFFVRGAEPSGILLINSAEIDPAFSTAADYLFAKFVATERIRKFLTEQLSIPPNSIDSTLQFKKNAGLKWTGEKSNLIELAYGIYGTMQINDGNTTISDIIEWLEESLNVSLTRYYRRFSEIKMRKSISKTKYLDDMRDALSKYITDGDAYKPHPIKPFSKPK